MDKTWYINAFDGAQKRQQDTVGQVNGAVYLEVQTTNGIKVQCPDLFCKMR